MKLRDQIKENAPDQQRIRIEVEDWNAVVYAYPFTIGESAKIGRKYPNLDSSPMANIEFMVDALIMKLQDEDGEKVFTLEDKAWLKTRPVAEISEVFAAFGGSTGMEDMEKN